MMFERNLNKLAKILKEKKLIVATAESCTGGLLASRLTDVPGSSVYLYESHITYANDAKHKYLGVSKEILDTYGAVSEECARAMADGLQQLSNCDVAICTTGIAGPDGGTKEKPVGTVFVSVKYKGQIVVKKFVLKSFIPRKLMKYLFTEKALKLAYDVICEKSAT